MNATQQDDKLDLTSIMDLLIRIGIILLLAAWCFDIVKPFIMPVMWGVIIAVAVHPLYGKLVSATGGRRKVMAVLLTVSALLLLITPTVIIGISTVEGTQDLVAWLDREAIEIPPPPGLAERPVIGKTLHKTWMLASTNLDVLLTQLAPQIREGIGWLLSKGLGTGMAVLQFAFSIIIAGVFLASADAAGGFLHNLAIRISGERGRDLVDLAGATVRSVAQGVLGVAIIQALMAALGMFLAGVPGAGLWTVLVLMLAVAQLPPILVLGPIIFYVFSYASPTVATLFMVWSLLVSASDGFLKPLLLGRGLDIPMLIILIGAIGGMISSGIIGLFVGAVVLALGYKLFLAWLQTDQPDSGQEAMAKKV